MFHKYLDNHDQIMMIALISSLVFSGIGLYYVLVVPDDNALIAMLTGIVVHSILLAGIYHGHNSKQRLRYGFVFAIISGIAFCCGSYAANSLIIATLGFLILLPLVGLVNPHNVLLSVSLVFSGISYILGFGMQSSLVGALNYGLYFALGALILVMLGIIRVAVRAYLFNIHETLPLHSITYQLHINHHSVLYTGGLIIAVLVSNFVYFHFHLAHGYWLPLTTFLIIKSSHDVSVTRSIHRLSGTLLGGAIAFIWSVFVSSKVIMALAMFPMLYLCIVAISKHYGSFTFFFTINICNFINLFTDTGAGIVEQRLAYTFIGVVIVIVILQAIRLIINKITIGIVHNK